MQQMVKPIAVIIFIFSKKIIILKINIYTGTGTVLSWTYTLNNNGGTARVCGITNCSLTMANCVRCINSTNCLMCDPSAASNVLQAGNNNGNATCISK